MSRGIGGRFATFGGAQVGGRVVEGLFVVFQFHFSFAQAWTSDESHAKHDFIVSFARTYGVASMLDIREDQAFLKTETPSGFVDSWRSGMVIVRWCSASERFALLKSC
jgi:hypothetical protein